MNKVVYLKNLMGMIKLIIQRILLNKFQQKAILKT